VIARELERLASVTGGVDNHVRVSLAQRGTHHLSREAVMISDQDTDPASRVAIECV
jgi:hypothetical protein